MWASSLLSGRDRRSSNDIPGQAGSPNGVRTRVSTLRGWCPGPLDDGTGRLGEFISGVRPPKWLLEA